MPQTALTVFSLTVFLITKLLTNVVIMNRNVQC